MQTTDLLRHQLIKKLTTQGHENGVEVAAGLWRPLAVALVLIIGAGGFDSLYARSVYLSQQTYPWLTAGLGAPEQTDQRFCDLEKSLQEQSPAVAREANCLLLVTFTNILVSMIGESLTMRILNSAWDIDPKENTLK